MGWQPIETAPKDGEVIDLWAADDRFPAFRIADAYWQGTPERGYWWAPNFDYDGADGRVPVTKFTHWMPFPAPPTTTNHTKSNEGE